MCTTSRLVPAGLALAALVASPLVARAQELRPFSIVQTVGTSTLAWDKIILKDGNKEIAAIVVAENPMFYVLERFGEYRAVGKDKVASVSKNDKVVRETGHVDQVLLKNGHVLTGKIVQERGDGMVEVKQANGRNSLYAWKDKAVAVIFKEGKKIYPAPGS
jgi:hypothetical protein